MAEEDFATAGYFERMEQEASPLRAETEAFTKSYMAGAQLLDLSGCGRVGCSELEDCPEVQICYLHSNALQVLEHVNCCPRLRKLDVHGNKLRTLPGPTFWSELICLEVLHLHTNNLRDIDDIHGLTVLPRLAILSLYRNPIALHPFYRSRIIKAMAPNIHVLDHFAVSLEEVLGDQVDTCGYHFRETFGAFSKKLRFKAAAPLTSRCVAHESYLQLTTDCRVTRFVDHVDCLVQEVASARRLSLRYNPAALIQRCWRGYRVRAGLYRARAARRMQGVTRGFLVRRRKALGLDPNTARSTRMPAVFLQNVVWRVYFTADMRYMMEDLASRALAKAGIDIATQFTRSDFLVVRPAENAAPWSHADGTGVDSGIKWTVGGVVRRTRTSVTAIGRQARQSLWMRQPNVRGHYEHVAVEGSRLLARKPTTVLSQPDEKPALVNHFQTALSESVVPTALEGAAMPHDPRTLISWTAPNARALTTLLDMVDLVNAGQGAKFWPPLHGHTYDHIVRVVSDYSIRRLAACCSIQACWRAHQRRVCLTPPLQILLRQSRGRICLQRWWRWRALGRRLDFLRDMHHLASSIQSPEVYLPASHVQHIDTGFARSVVVFPEQRRVAYLRNEVITIATDHTSSRQGFPRWNAAGLVPVHELSPHGQMKTLTGSQLLCSGATVEPICPSVRDVIFLSHHNYVRFIYSSVAEARARAAVLLAKTWKSVLHGSFALRLMSKAMLQQYGAATCIQSFFRGARVRVAYAHHQRVIARLPHSSQWAQRSDAEQNEGWTVRNKLINGSCSASSELEVFGQAPAAFGTEDYLGSDYAALKLHPDEQNRLARELRDSMRRAAREQNEIELAELAVLQLNARQQRRQKAQSVPKTHIGERQVPDEMAQLAKQLRATDIVDRRLRAERVKINRVAAREQLRREQQVVEETRAEKRKTEAQNMAAYRDQNDVSEVHAIKMVRQRMRVKLNTQRGLGGDRLFAANFVRQTNAIAKQMGLSEYCRYRDYAQNHTLAVVRQRVLQSELQKQNNADLFTIRMVEQQRRVATDTIDMQNKLATARAVALRAETERRVHIRTVRELSTQTSADAIMATQRQPFATNYVIAKFDSLPGIDR